ncbi:MAG: hypothetical protein WBX02_04130 [Terriglobales bacterium]
MATARELPIEDFNANPTITIDATLIPSPQACMVAGANEMSVTFSNTSGQSIQISFVPPAVQGGPVLFSNISSFPNTQTIPAGTNASVNYTLTVNGVVSEPYCIQINDGPMIVQLATVNNVITYTPPTVAVPETSVMADGTLAILGAISGNSYPISWTNNDDPFTPAITSSGSASHASNPGTAGNTYTYTAGPPPDDQPGGGTVIIRST